MKWGYLGASFNAADIVSGFITSGDFAPGAVNSGDIASGSVGSVHLRDGSILTVDVASGAIQSGQVGSGSVPGFFGTTRAIQSGTVGVFDFGSGAVIAGAMGSGSVVSGNVASGQIGSVHIGSGQLTGFELGSGSIVSGRVASGQIGNFHVASGQIQGLAGAGVPNLASGTVNANNLSSGSVVSGHVASGTIYGLTGSLPHVASGTFTGFELGSGAIVSGRIASGQVGNFHVASGQIQGLAGAGVPNIASGTFTGFELGSGAIVSGRVASGQIGFGHLANASVWSGTFASGQIASGHLASGLIANIAGAGVSGYYEDLFATAEPISGGGPAVAVAFTQSGTIQTAMASVSGRMPAIGIVTSNYLSGATATLFWGGRVFASGGLINFSGWMNQPVYVGRSGQIVASGAPTSSGDIQQILGVSFQQSGIFMSLGDPLEGVIAGSGDVGSGSILGQAGGGYFNVASGTLTAVDFASGAHVRTAMQAGGQPMVSGTATMLPVIVQIAAENVSGNCAVYATPSGTIGVAMAATSGRWPAIGVALGNALSGLTVIWAAVGALQLTSGMADYSGYVGRRVWLGRSGQIVTLSGSFGSGGHLSGDVGQPLGVVANSGAIWFNVNPVFWSGGPLGLDVGGAF